MAQRTGTSYAGEEECHRVFSVFSSFVVVHDLRSLEVMRWGRNRWVQKSWEEWIVSWWLKKVKDVSENTSLSCKMQVAAEDEDDQVNDERTTVHFYLRMVWCVEESEQDRKEEVKKGGGNRNRKRESHEIHLNTGASCWWWCNVSLLVSGTDSPLIDSRRRTLSMVCECVWKRERKLSK